jgi:hypothetical protein
MKIQNWLMGRFQLAAGHEVVVRHAWSGPAQSLLQPADPRQPRARGRALEAVTTPQVRAVAWLPVTHRWTERCSVFVERTSSAGGVRPEKSCQWGLTREGWRHSGEVQQRRCVPTAVWTKEGCEEAVELKKD